jgi:hypothetical protein
MFISHKNGVVFSSLDRDIVGLGLFFILLACFVLARIECGSLLFTFRLGCAGRLRDSGSPKISHDSLVIQRA